MAKITMTVYEVPDVGGPGYTFGFEGDTRWGGPFGEHKGGVLRPFDSIGHLDAYLAEDGSWGSHNDFMGGYPDWVVHSTREVDVPDELL